MRPTFSGLQNKASCRTAAMKRRQSGGPQSGAKKKATDQQPKLTAFFKHTGNTVTDPIVLDSDDDCKPPQQAQQQENQQVAQTQDSHERSSGGLDGTAALDTAFLYPEDMEDGGSLAAELAAAAAVPLPDDDPGCAKVQQQPAAEKALPLASSVLQSWGKAPASQQLPSVSHVSDSFMPEKSHISQTVLPANTAARGSGGAADEISSPQLSDEQVRHAQGKGAWAQGVMSPCT